MKYFKVITLLFTLSFSILIAETEFAEPKPSIDNPRQIVFPLMKADKESINHVLSYVNNVMKFYRPENTEFAVVAYSQGIKALLKNQDKEIIKRIEALMTYDVEFIICGNTMRTLKIDDKEVLHDVEKVTAGVVELIERQKMGWTYVNP
jgi:intracellular sulfur oxidation DsrE/DsrF family protein